MTMRFFLYRETGTAEPPPARRLPGSPRYLYKADAATPPVWDGSGPKAQGTVLPEGMRFGGPFESSLAELVAAHQVADRSKSSVPCVRRQIIRACGLAAGMWKHFLRNIINQI